mgnify:CR=1 FL=1
MKELIRQYGSTAIAVMTALLLIGIVSRTSVFVEKSIPESKALCAETAETFEGYWRSR